MSQNLDNKNLDKNFKLMAMSAVVLLILFIYTIYKGGTHIQGGSYYLGIGFLFILLVVALFVKLNQEKLKQYFNKDKEGTSFSSQLKSQKSKILKEIVFVLSRFSIRVSRTELFRFPISSPQKSSYKTVKRVSKSVKTHIKSEKLDNQKFLFFLHFI